MRGCRSASPSGTATSTSAAGRRARRAPTTTVPRPASAAGSIDTEADCRRRGRLLGTARVRLDDARLSERERRREQDLARRACDASAPPEALSPAGQRRSRASALSGRGRGSRAALAALPLSSGPGATTTAKTHARDHLAHRHALGGVRQQRRALQQPGRRPARQGRRGRARRRRQVARAPRGARQAAAARPRRRACSTRARRSSRSASSPRYGMYDGEAPAAGMITGIGRVQGAGMHDRRQRRDREGRHLLPDDGEEAPARAGDRAAEPPAVHLPGRLRRRLPAAAGRGVPRSRALRPHLLQPGQHERAGHPADRGGDGLVHGGRRLRAGDERRDGHRQQPGHDLPRRPAAGEGGDRRGRQRRGPRRRRRAHAPLRRRRPPRRERRARAAHRAPHRRQPQPHASPRR